MVYDSSILNEVKPMTEKSIEEMVDFYIDRIHELVESGNYYEASNLYEKIKDFVVEKVPA